MNSLTNEEQKTLREIRKVYYMPPITRRIDAWVEQYGRDLNVGWVKVLDQLHDILRDSQLDIENLLDRRIEEGKIKDKDQARKSIVGNAFSNSLIYIFLYNKIYENIPSHIYTTSHKSQIPEFAEAMVIKIGDETQKPDMDIVIYAKNKNSSPSKYILLSLKTSLRERAAQTYKWKLLMEVALHSPELSKKYNISYNPQIIPIVCFATTNFYDEINNPQQRGMLKFFDRAFIAKDLGGQAEDFIYSLSNLIPFVIDQLSLAE